MKKEQRRKSGKKQNEEQRLGKQYQIRKKNRELQTERSKNHGAENCMEEKQKQDFIAEQEENWCETGNPTRRMARTGNGMEGGRGKEEIGTWKL